jgi:hypothetical protein
MVDPGGNTIIDDARQDTDAETNPVAGFLEGAGPVQDVGGGIEKLVHGDWTEGLLDLASAGMDVKEIIADPINSFLSMGFGWIIEHVDFLKDPLDWVTGDQDALDLEARKWDKISEHVQNTAEALTDSVQKNCAHWQGPAADQYREFAQKQIKNYAEFSDCAKGVSGLVATAKTILNVVRTIIRDLITDTLAKIVTMLLRYPPPGYPVALAAEGVPFAIERGNECLGLVKKLRGAFANFLAILGDLLKRLPDFAVDLVWDVKAVVTKDLVFEGFGKGAATEVAKELTKEVVGIVRDEVNSSGSLDPEDQPKGSESHTKKEHDRRETTISPFTRSGSRRISGSLEDD